ncbi:MAG TPA: hypothetical protein VHN80_22110 [Kineosporiaceae bacterium]|nr:hypothetical protein [Kineosporiaceae bacterium]
MYVTTARLLTATTAGLLDRLLDRLLGRLLDRLLGRTLPYSAVIDGRAEHGRAVTAGGAAPRHRAGRVPGRLLDVRRR